jgi:hypothetical protein
LDAVAAPGVPRAVAGRLDQQRRLWMQTVGAQWVLLGQPHADTLVALVQTASNLPILLFALPAGVLAEFFDRRLILPGAQAFQTAVGVALVLLTYLGQMSPALLLLLTFLLGAGAAAQLPAYQAMIPDLVPTRELTSAAALGSISVNTARAIGPAIAGLLISHLGVTLCLRRQHCDVRSLLRRPGRRPGAVAAAELVGRRVSGWPRDRRPLDPPRAGRAPHPASAGALPRSCQRALGSACRPGPRMTRTGRKWIRSPACAVGYRICRRRGTAPTVAHARRAQCSRCRVEHGLRGHARRTGDGP